VHEVAPKVFRYLRNLDGYDQASIRESLNPRNNIESIFKAGESQGKSGSFFFFSQDRRFIIKTMTNSDYNAF
jgi:1-phosphatidylinositol-4-phosphate 5-kinase